MIIPQNEPKYPCLILSLIAKKRMEVVMVAKKRYGLSLTTKILPYIVEKKKWEVNERMITSKLLTKQTNMENSTKPIFSMLCQKSNSINILTVI